MALDSPENHHHHNNHHLLPPWLIKLLSLQSDIISDCLLSLTSPFLHRQPPKQTLNSAAPTAAQGNGNLILKKAVLGFVGAAYVCLVLTTVMVVSVAIGVGLVGLWVEEPIYIKENLYFDYTNVNPYAILDFGYGKLSKVVPVGHVCNVRLVFVMPESEYNQEIGMFQVVAEAFTVDGEVVTSASQPCMLQFRSQPIRLVHTFLMGVPLLFGITSEIQTINLPLLKYKEHFYPRTQSIKLSLIPRAGTPFLPQLYEAKVIVSSELPWRKELVRKWKWTFYVWTSIYVYLMLLVVLMCCFRSILFPTMTMDQRVSVVDDSVEEARNRPEVSEALRRWRQNRNKRKAMLLGGGDATSMSVTRDDYTSVVTEEVGDSESVCQ